VASRRLGQLRITAFALKTAPEGILRLHGVHLRGPPQCAKPHNKSAEDSQHSKE